MDDLQGSVRFIGRSPKARELQRLIHKIETGGALGGKWPDLLTQEFESAGDFVSFLRDQFMSEEQVRRCLTGAQEMAGWHDFAKKSFEDPRMAAWVLDAPAEATSEMSAGQRVLCGLYAGLFSQLIPECLVLIDEPENYLHPSLLALFVRRLHDLLDERKCFAIIASHSPVVVQETPSRAISVLERYGDTCTVERPKWEMFGESLDNITSRLFHTDFRSSHWKRTLRALKQNGVGADDLPKYLSRMPLSLLARTYFSYADGD